jgi:hypothetical protein
MGKGRVKFCNHFLDQNFLYINFDAHLFSWPKVSLTENVVNVAHVEAHRTVLLFPHLSAFVW